MTNLSNLRIGHLNVRGLECHIDGLKLLLDQNQYHFFATTETKLKASSPVGPIRIAGYNFIRHSLPSDRGRGTKTCGGVGIYVRKGIKAVTVAKSDYCANIPVALRFEFLVVQAKINNINIGIVVIYNPTGSNQLFAQNYEKLLFELVDFNFDRIYLVGDFNINVTTPVFTANNHALVNIHNVFNLIVLPTGPTRITDTGSSTIDLLITDCPNSIRTSKTSTANTISDHEIVFLIADVRIAEPVPRRIKIRNFRRVDPVRLQADFIARGHQNIVEENDTETKAVMVTDLLRSLLNEHAPETEIVVKDKRTPWITEEVKRATKFRDLAYALYARNPNRVRGDAQWRDYISKRDRANSLIFAAKKRYAETNFGNELPAKKLWNNLRREGIHNNKRSTTSADEHTDIDQLNNFFTDGHLQLRSRATRQTRSTTRNLPDFTNSGFNFVYTDATEVSKMINEITTSATGIDDIPISFIKMMGPHILPLLVNLFNAIIDSCQFPTIWKKAIVTPIPKTSNPVDPTDYRPISVLPALSKIFEKILLDQVTNYLNNHQPQLLAKHQSGYRKHHSTTTALTKVTHDIYQNLEENRCTVMVLVDLSLAFNCVKHEKLGIKLREEFGFCAPACDLVASYLRHRTQCVKVGGRKSAERVLLDGTPQGSCLSALLFSLYVNSMPEVLRCEYHLYADDLQVYISGPVQDVDRMIEILNADLDAIEHWTTTNNLFPNPRKTQAIIFSKQGDVVPQNEILFCGESIPFSKEVTNLGLKMDNNMKWTAQVNDVTRKVFGTMKVFRRFAPVLSVPTRKKLMQAVIVPFLTYADTVYTPGLSARLTEQLHRCFKAGVRFVFNIRRRNTTAAVRHTILGRDLVQHYQFRINCFMHGAYNDIHPGYILQHLQKSQSERTRSFNIPRNSTSSRKSVLISGALSWNALPPEAKHSPTVSSFKKSLNNN